MREHPRHRCDVDDVGGSAGFEQWEECPRAPDAPQVDRVHDLLGLLGREFEKSAPSGEPRVVDEEPHGLVTLPDPGRHRIDLGAVGDVANLGLCAELRGGLFELLRSAGQEDAMPAAGGEGARGRSADPARSPGDDGHGHPTTIEIVTQPLRRSGRSGGSGSHFETVSQ